MTDVELAYCTGLPSWVSPDVPWNEVVLDRLDRAVIFVQCSRCRPMPAVDWAKQTKIDLNPLASRVTMARYMIHDSETGDVITAWIGQCHRCDTIQYATGATHETAAG